MTKSSRTGEKASADRRRARLLSAVSLLSVSLGVSLEVTPAQAASSGGTGFQTTDIKGESSDHKHPSDGDQLNQSSIKFDSLAHKTQSSIKGESRTGKFFSTDIKGKSHDSSQVKLDITAQKGDMP